MKRIELSLHAAWSLDDWNALACGKARIHLDPESQRRVEANRKALVDRIARGEVMYGVNTGFGSLCTTIIPQNELEALQANLIRSHAVGTGPQIDKPLVRLMLASKVRSLSQGY